MGFPINCIKYLFFVAFKLLLFAFMLYIPSASLNAQLIVISIYVVCLWAFRCAVIYLFHVILLWRQIIYFDSDEKNAMWMHEKSKELKFGSFDNCSFHEMKFRICAIHIFWKQLAQLSYKHQNIYTQQNSDSWEPANDISQANERWFRVGIGSERSYSKI